MLGLVTDPQAWAALATLTVLEIVLGIDNLVFISVLVARLNEPQATRARQIGLALALVLRILMLFGITTLMTLREPLFRIGNIDVSWHGIILVGGGLFLVAKATWDIHGEIEGNDEHAPQGHRPARSALWLIVLQVVVIDLVFSVDSILTAIGMAQDLAVMIAAVLIAIAVMYVASGPTAGFISRHPTTKMLALAFLILIGVALIADGFEFHIPRGYIYFAMVFAAAVEFFNVLARRNRQRRKPR